jgi:hypothetical protein
MKVTMKRIRGQAHQGMLALGASGATGAAAVMVEPEWRSACAGVEAGAGSDARTVPAINTALSAIIIMNMIECRWAISDAYPP